MIVKRMDVMSYHDRVVLISDAPHPCPHCGVMSYMWVQRMTPDALVTACMGCDPDQGGTL